MRRLRTRSFWAPAAFHSRDSLALDKPTVSIRSHLTTKPARLHLTMFTLLLSAELTGVTNLRPDDTQDNPFWYMFKVQCTSCRETHANYIGVNRFEANDISGSRGEANFVWKCKNCKRASSASIIAAPAAYEQTEPPKSQKIIEFDCRGLEFVEFKAEGEWLAEGLDSGTKFTGIELVDGEWYEYDEKAGDEVSIKEIKWEIRRS
ncbi:hypothetical protein AK830_g12456 [Neonectria ditissima]|uniref:DUF866 domain-containing protein n=1 Tax=Neonectria ditissima TaxID=78410 RepID=A0A0N8H4R6_9HYPO|nr:hypothetical protein AK830_g12456 [Neonectria ditissima]